MSVTQHIATTSLELSYPFTIERLRAEVDKLRGHSFSEPKLYKEGVKAIATCRGFRVGIEGRRKELKAESLAFGREVDRVAKELTGVVETVEDELKAAKQRVDDERERVKREAAEAERRRVEEEIRAKREAEEALLREQRRQEEERLAEQRRELEAMRKQMAEESARMAAEAEKLRQERTEHEKATAAARAEKEERELAERIAAEQEEERIRKLEYEDAKAKRLAALAPDRERLKTFRVCITDLLGRSHEWKPSDTEFWAAWTQATNHLDAASAVLRAFEITAPKSESDNGTTTFSTELREDTAHGVPRTRKTRARSRTTLDVKGDAEG